MTPKPCLIGALLVGTLTVCEPLALAETEASAWTDARTERFRVVGNDPPPAVERIAIEAERLLSALDRLAPAAESQPMQPITWLAFGSNESYAMFALPGWDAGYLIPHKHGVYAAFVSSEAPTRQIYRHVVMYLLESRFPGLPEWFRQGVAEIYSALEFEDGKIRLGQAIPTHLMYLNQIDLGIAALIDPLRRTGPVIGFNLRSWALVHYLIFGEPELAGRVDTYLDLIAGLERPQRAFKQAFGRTPQEMDARVNAYIRHGSLPSGILDVGELPDVEVVSRSLSKTEVLLAFAELTLHTRVDPGEAAVDALRQLAADPTAGAQVYTALGEGEHALGNDEAAGRALRRAVELDPDAFKAWLLLGEALADRVRAAGAGAAPELIDEAVVALERALQLRPEHTAAGERLSFLYASLPAPSERAIEVGERALELQPGRTDLVFNLLLMRAKLGEAEAVRELLDRLAALGGAEAQVVSGREMLLQLQLRATRELMRADRLDDAIGILAEVQARTTSEQLRATATEWIDHVQAIRDYNAFVSAYNEAVDAYNSDQLDLALERLTSLSSIARSGEQARAIERLRSEVEYWRD